MNPTVTGSATTTTRPRRLLVVEDDPRVGRFILHGLRGEGYQVDHAANGEAAKVLEEAAPYDLVLLDHMLHDRSGIAVLQDWRSTGHGMPVVMLTARDGPEDRRLAFAAGATAFLAKPFRLDDLFDLVASLLP